MRQISLEEFETTYRPEFDGESFLPRDWPDERVMLGKAVAERRCWTLAVNDEGRPIVVSGHVLRDRLHSVITEVPYDEGDEILVIIDSGYKE